MKTFTSVYPNRLQSEHLRIVKSNEALKILCCADPNYSDKTPLLIMNGQFEHTAHFTDMLNLEACIGSTGPVFKHGHCVFDKTIHTPYIIYYDYKNSNLPKVTTDYFANAFEDLIDRANLSDIDAILASCGAITGVKTSKNPRMKNIVALNMPIPRCLLADTTELKRLFSLSELIKNPSRLNPKYFLTYLYVVNTMKDYVGFTHDYAHQFRDLEYVKQMGDWNKVKALFSIANDNKPSNFWEMLMGWSAATINHLSPGELSDGACTVDEEFLKAAGIDYMLYDDGCHYNCDSSPKTFELAYTQLLELKRTR